MASNPFFSGRIPTELYQQAEKHCQETGDSKTELLIKALSSYLNFPVAIPGKTFVALPVEVSKEMFERLEERVKVLENSLKIDTIPVIRNDNDDNTKEEKQEIICDNSVKTDDNKSDSLEIEPNRESVIKNDNITDNNYKNEKIETEKQEVQPSFKSILNNEVSTRANITIRQVSRLAGRAIEKLKHQGKNVEPKNLLEEPIEVTQREGINVNGYPYKLFYLGENLKEKPLWDLIPDDNVNYQIVIKEINT